MKLTPITPVRWEATAEKASVVVTKKPQSTTFAWQVKGLVSPNGITGAACLAGEAMTFLHAKHAADKAAARINHALKVLAGWEESD